MKIETSKKENVTVVKVDGRLDMTTFSVLEKRLATEIDEGARQLVVDFSNLVYISSVGLRILLKTAKKLDKLEGQFRLCSLKKEIRKIFDIAGFSGILNIDASLEDSLAQF